MQRPSCCRPILGDPARLRQGGQVPVFAVIYHYTDEHEPREEVRPIHRTFLVGLGEAMLCAGPFAPNEDAGALLLFQASSKEAVLALLDEDQGPDHSARRAGGPSHFGSGGVRVHCQPGLIGAG